MIVDYIFYGFLIFGVAKLLNITVFKSKPASKPEAWLLTTVIFFLNLIALSILKALRYQVMSESLPSPIIPQTPIDAMGALIFASIFLSLLNRKKKESIPKPVPNKNNQAVDIEKESAMNDTQRKTLLGIALVIALMVFYPPYEVKGYSGNILKTGYGFLFSLPSYTTSNYVQLPANVNIATLIAQIFGVSVAGGLVFIASKR